MRRVRFWYAIAVLGILLPARPAGAGTSDFEVREGSYVTLGVAGAQRAVTAQILPLLPALPPVQDLRSGRVVRFPKIDLAFGEYVNLFENQEFLLELDPVSHEATLEFPLWVVDSDGNHVELTSTLDTSVPSNTDCGGFPFCFGQPWDPDHCFGQPWDPQSGELRLVGVTLVPFLSGTTVDCTGIAFVIEATIPAGDGDGDGLVNAVDNCPEQANAQQNDGDGDGIGDACDNCPADYNPFQNDADGDGAGNACQPLRVNFQPAGAPQPGGFLMDAGLPFDPADGRGWLGAPVQTRDRNVLPDQLLDTFAFSSEPSEWEAEVLPGIYEVTLTVGDAQYAQGPHLVHAEQVEAIDRVSTAAGDNATASLGDLAVVDGRLTVEIGGGGGLTTLNYVTAVEASEQPFTQRFVNFQPASSAHPAGFLVDDGAAFDPARGYGWEADLQSMTRDRGDLGDAVLDTFFFAGATKTWEIELAADFYEVRISIGDALYGQGPQRVVVEGETWLEGATTSPGEFLTFSGRALVIDGALTVSIGGAGGNTTLNYLGLVSLPRDLDGDGWPNLIDNCLEVVNPDQADSDQDGVGDHCSADTDEDGWPDPLDNCPGQANPGQDDADEDNYGDACDCAPTDPAAFAIPIEVPSLLLDAAPGTTTLAWSNVGQQAGSGTAYDLVTGSLSTLQDQGMLLGSCLANDLDATQRSDGRIPAVGQGYFYLVRADNACGPGTYGSDDVSARVSLDVDSPCP